MSHPASKRRGSHYSISRFLNNTIGWWGRDRWVPAQVMISGVRGKHNAVTVYNQRQ